MSGLGKALQRKGHLVEIILPKYDCMQYEHVTDLKVYKLLALHAVLRRNFPVSSKTCYLLINQV